MAKNTKKEKKPITKDDILLGIKIILTGQVLINLLDEADEEVAWYKGTIKNRLDSLHRSLEPLIETVGNKMIEKQKQQNIDDVFDYYDEITTSINKILKGVSI
jgi:hypothetical protein